MNLCKENIKELENEGVFRKNNEKKLKKNLENNFIDNFEALYSSNFKITKEIRDKLKENFGERFAKNIERLLQNKTIEENKKNLYLQALLSNVLILIEFFKNFLNRFKGRFYYLKNIKWLYKLSLKQLMSFLVSISYLS